MLGVKDLKIRKEQNNIYHFIKKEKASNNFEGCNLTGQILGLLFRAY
jgi:hypothetical protein